MNHPTVTVDFKFVQEQPDHVDAGSLVLPFLQAEDGQCMLGHLKNKEVYASVIEPLIERVCFTGELGKAVGVGSIGALGWVILLGLGKRSTLDREAIRQAAALAYQKAVQQGSSAMSLDVNLCPELSSYLQAFSEGVLLKAHVDRRFKSKLDGKGSPLTQVDFLGSQVADNAIDDAKKIAQGVYLARELVNGPANHVTPTTLAETAKTLAQYDGFECDILEEKDCAQLGMGAYLSVAQGSDAPAKFIHLSYTPKQIDAKAKFKKIALIGKGVTFDSGGLNLKVGSQAQIESMKYDMAGAATVLGVAQAVGLLKPSKELHFIVAATENMINGHASRPGDVVKASNGTTIEVNNTDAEGRLTLADSLVYAEKLQVDAIVDLATLTGAIVVALGERMAGLFGNHQPLNEQLQVASLATGEKIWPMPLENEYYASMHSVTADLSNVSKKRGGGSITAALFLQQFIQHTPWVHLDIAGPVFTQKSYCYHNAGATGFGVRLLMEWLLHG